MGVDKADVAKTEISSILLGEKVYFAPNQIVDQPLLILIGRVKRLGGTVVDDAAEATIIIENPAHQIAKAERPILARSAPQAEIQPYHFISLCLLHSRRVHADEVTPMPLMVHPDNSRNRAPLKAWISINVMRVSGETPLEAKEAVTAALETHGALEVTKRSAADLLIVDVHSAFYKTVLDERDANQRTHQRIAERDWLQTCFAENKLSWLNGREAKQQEAGEAGDVSDTDSMARESPSSRQRGPGRPTGVPRTEYTPQDDDFLARYLAYWHANGSWYSRKTYKNMAAQANVYPLIARHSPQSWHERFKKRSAQFEVKIGRLVKEKLNGELKTKAERTKAQADARERGVPAPARNGHVAVTGQEQSTTAEREGARLTAQALERLDASQASADAGPSAIEQPGPEPVIVQQIVVEDPPEEPNPIPDIPAAIEEQPVAEELQPPVPARTPSPVRTEPVVPRSPAPAQIRQPQSPAEPVVRPATELIRTRDDAISTPASSRISGPRRSLLREELAASARKRQRSEVSMGSAVRPGLALESRHTPQHTPSAPRTVHTPDRVLASTSFTRKVEQSPAVTAPRPSSRARSPVLSPAERHAKILSGEQAAREMYQKYAAKLAEYSNKYGKSPGETVELIRRFSSGRGGVQWGEVDERLKRVFGY